MSPGLDQSHARYEAIFAEVEAPFAFVDLDAMGSNAAAMLERAGRQADPRGEQVAALPSAAGTRPGQRRALRRGC